MASDNQNRFAKRISERLKSLNQSQEEEVSTSSSNTQGSTDTQSRFAKRINDRLSSFDKSATVDEDFVTVFLSDASSYLRKAKSQYEGIGFSNASDTWKENRKSYTNLLARGQSIRDYLLKNKSSMDGNAYESVMKQVNSINDALRSYSGAFSDARQYYSQWETEDEYNKWKKET